MKPLLPACHRSRKPRLCWRVFGVLWLWGIAVVYAGNWPGFRGPDASGVAATEKVPTHFGQTSNLLWRARVPAGLSSPVIWQGRVFLTAAEGPVLSTICLECSTGKQLWEQKITAEKLEQIQPSNSHASSTPVTDGKRLYVYFGSFGLLAYDLAGKELWRKTLPMPKTQWGTGTSPVLAGGQLVIFLSLGNKSCLLIVDPANGEEIGKASMPEYNESYSTPISWKENGKCLVGMACAGRFTAFDLAHREEAWWVSGVAHQACSTPVAAGDRLIIAAAGVFGEPSNMTPPPSFEEALKKYGHGDEKTIAYESLPDDLLFVDRQTSNGAGNMTLKRALTKYFKLKEGDQVSRQHWEQIRNGLTGFRAAAFNRTTLMSVRTGGSGNATESQVVWKESKGVPEVPSPLLWGDRIYLIRNGGILACRNLETGSLVYDERLDSPGGYFASPVLADGRLYLVSDRGTVTVVKAGDAFEVLARNELGEPIIASPAISDNALYIRSSGHLWAFGMKSN